MTSSLTALRPSPVLQPHLPRPGRGLALGSRLAGAVVPATEAIITVQVPRRPAQPGDHRGSGWPATPRPTRWR